MKLSLITTSLLPFHIQFHGTTANNCSITRNFSLFTYILPRNRVSLLKHEINGRKKHKIWLHFSLDNLYSLNKHNKLRFHFVCRMFHDFRMLRIFCRNDWINKNFRMNVNLIQIFMLCKCIPSKASTSYLFIGCMRYGSGWFWIPLFVCAEKSGLFESSYKLMWCFDPKF